MDKFHDVEFEEVNNKIKDKQISGTNHLYYNTSQVAQMLGIQDSKVRYYSKVFDDILKIEVINKQRKYKQEDIDKLRYMLELQAEGMSLKQIEQYCSEVSFEDDGKVQIKESNPLSIKALAQKLMDHQQEQIAAMEERIVTRLENYILNQENNNKEFYYHIGLEEKWGNASKFTVSSSSWFVITTSSFKARDINNSINSTEEIYLPSLNYKLKEKNYLEIYHDNYVELWFPLT